MWNNGQRCRGDESGDSRSRRGVACPEQMKDMPKGQRGVGKVGNEGRDGTEIDIMEKPWLDDRINYALHWDGYGKDHKSKGTVVKVPGVMEGWHTFGLCWKADEYVFYVDGKETWRTNAGGVSQVPEYIKLSDEIGDWAGDIKKAELPDEKELGRSYNTKEKLLAHPEISKYVQWKREKGRAKPSKRRKRGPALRLAHDFLAALWLMPTCE